jgi:hypothetical protein
MAMAEWKGTSRTHYAPQDVGEVRDCRRVYGEELESRGAQGAPPKRVANMTEPCEETFDTKNEEQEETC